MTQNQKTEIALINHNYIKKLCEKADELGIDRNEFIKNNIVFLAKTSDGYDYSKFN